MDRRTFLRQTAIAAAVAAVAPLALVAEPESVAAAPVVLGFDPALPGSERMTFGELRSDKIVVWTHAGWPRKEDHPLFPKLVAAGLA